MKYHSKKTVIDGITFDSKLEADRYVRLRTLLFAGEIHNLQLQPEFQIEKGWLDPKTGEKHRSRFYRADFRYIDIRTNRWIVEDTKGVETADFKLKWELVQSQYPEFLFRKVTKADV